MDYSFVEFTHTQPASPTFSFNFSYVSKADIKVWVEGMPSGYVWVNENTITVTPEPALGSKVKIFRDTEKLSRIVDFQDGSTLTESQLDIADLQLFYLIQEALDKADASIQDSFGVWDGRGKVASNFGAPIDDADLVTKGWVTGISTSYLLQMQSAVTEVEGYLGALTALTVGVIDVPNGVNGSAVYDGVTNTLTFYIAEGKQGPRGNKGPVGDKGATGDKGPTGDKGVAGSKGPTGNQGPMGSVPLGLAFGQMRVDNDGFLIIEYVGNDLSTTFSIDENGDLYATI